MLPPGYIARVHVRITLTGADGSELFGESKWEGCQLLRVVDGGFGQACEQYSHSAAYWRVRYVCSGKYDFFYLPIDYKNKCNLGYAFVNFTEPKAAAVFFMERHQQRWQEFNSKKARGSSVLSSAPRLSISTLHARRRCYDVPPSLQATSTLSLIAFMSKRQ